jgi:hypothetical protein
MRKSRHSGIAIGIVLILILILLSVFVNERGWSSGAEKILTAALVLAGTIPLKEMFQ